MSETQTKTITYPGNRLDLVGQVVGPNARRELFMVTAATLQSGREGDQTVATLTKVTAEEAEAKVTPENKLNVQLLRREAIQRERGIDIRKLGLPPAFRDVTRMIAELPT